MINGKTKLNSIKVVISKVLVDSSVTHDEFVLGIVCQKYDGMKEEIIHDLFVKTN